MSIAGDSERKESESCVRMNIGGEVLRPGKSEWLEKNYGRARVKRRALRLKKSAPLRRIGGTVSPRRVQRREKIHPRREDWSTGGGSREKPADFPQREDGGVSEEEIFRKKGFNRESVKTLTGGSEEAPFGGKN